MITLIEALNVFLSLVISTEYIIIIKRDCKIKVILNMLLIFPIINTTCIVILYTVLLLLLLTYCLLVLLYLYSHSVYCIVN